MEKYIINKDIFVEIVKETFKEGVDNRLNYDDKKRMRIIKMYLENVGIRSIGRLERIHNTVVLN